ncbi:hypothetical protein RHAL1_02238 [Beijerinckiaceae bacterium RH AL1]|nr:DUF3572 family protein [Beijerinckiaceae bacterium]VVB46331.1 hypothetical protein RHCH11_RHCH11_02193 [Beijerinckiaceae bacterium RH CH11]VVB46416.1 hypothetical protein RHAL8_02189 [Beijerinckiaceae bacterium RH AL8]VVC55321.1 hypothetical protein RHAL1_02238 [Beijerinckiaceae bacterium RH AL1]
MSPHGIPPSIHRKRHLDKEALDAFSAEALTFLAGDEERLRRFLDITGLSAATLRRAAAGPTFAADLLDYMAADERCLVAFAQETGRDLAELERMRQELAAPPGND